MIKNHYLHIAIVPFLIGNTPSAFAEPILQNEAKILNNTNYAEANCNLNKAVSRNCLNFKNSYSPKDKLDDEKAMKLADYFKKFRDFCFDLDVNNMLNGSINFNYR